MNFCLLITVTHCEFLPVDSGGEAVAHPEPCGERACPVFQQHAQHNGGPILGGGEPLHPLRPLPGFRQAQRLQGPLRRLRAQDAPGAGKGTGVRGQVHREPLHQRAASVKVTDPCFLRGSECVGGQGDAAPDPSP